MSRQPYRTPGVTGGGGRRPFSYTRRDADPGDEEEEEEGFELTEPQEAREQLVFDRDTGKLVVKEGKPKIVATRTVLTGIASSGFF